MIKKFKIFENINNNEINSDINYIINSICQTIYQNDFTFDILPRALESSNCRITIKEKSELKDYINNLSKLYNILGEIIGLNLIIEKNQISFKFHILEYDEFITKLKNTAYKFIYDDLRKEKLKNKYKI